MVTIKSLKVVRNKPNSLDITWSFEPTGEDLNDYRLDLYISQAPSKNIDEYDLVASGLEASAYAYEDFTPSGLAHGTRQWYYKLKIIDTVNDEEVISDYYYMNHERPNKKWSKI